MLAKKNKFTMSTESDSSTLPLNLCTRTSLKDCRPISLIPAIQDGNLVCGVQTQSQQQLNARNCDEGDEHASANDIHAGAFWNNVLGNNLATSWSMTSLCQPIPVSIGLPTGPSTIAETRQIPRLKSSASESNLLSLLPVVMATNYQQPIGIGQSQEQPTAAAGMKPSLNAECYHQLLQRLNAQVGPVDWSTPSTSATVFASPTQTSSKSEDTSIGPACPRHCHADSQPTIEDYNGELTDDQGLELDLAASRSYAEYRKKNNASAKKSRETRRQRYSRTLMCVAQLERENAGLRVKYEVMQRCVTELRLNIVNSARQTTCTDHLTQEPNSDKNN